MKTGLDQDSLGKAVGLESPYFQLGFAPDVYLIEILSRKALCDFGGAEGAIQRFKGSYGRELASLQQVTAEKPKPSDYYGRLISYYDEKDPLRFQRFLLHLPAVMENQQVLNEASDELDKVDNLGRRKYTVERPAGWDQFAASMKAEWNTKALALRDNSARAALSEADYLLARLKSTFAQVDLIDLDIATNATKNFNLQSALNFPVREPAEAKRDDEKLHWPFENEVWEDELEFLKMKNPSKCAQVPSESLEAQSAANGQ
jgi:hypothetical protein